MWCVVRRQQSYTAAKRWWSVRDVVVRQGPTWYKSEVAACRHRVSLTSVWCVCCRTTTLAAAGPPPLPLALRLQRTTSAVGEAAASWDDCNDVATTTVSMVTPWWPCHNMPTYCCKNHYVDLILLSQQLKGLCCLKVCAGRPVPDNAW